MDIEFRADGGRLARTGPQSRPAAGSRGYLRCSFRLDGDWDGLRAAARFFDERGAEHAVLLDGGSCEVPAEATAGRWFRVALMGAAGGRVLTTNAVTVTQEVV